MNLTTPIKEVSQTYKKYASRLEKLGIKTLEDFLYHAPARYEDYSLISKIGEVQAGETVTIQGEVLEIKNLYTSRFKKIQKGKIKDKTGVIEVIWFNQPYLVKYIKNGDIISLSGKIKDFNGKKILESPEYELLSLSQAEPHLPAGKQGAEPSGTIHTGRLVPVYPETRGVSSKWLRRQIHNILNDHRQNLLEYIPYSILKNNGLTGLLDAIEQLHFPKNLENIEKARSRLSFNELFLLHLTAKQRSRNWEKNLTGSSFSISRFNKDLENFLQKLPFELTMAQKKAVKEIFSDLEGKKPMNRLLEGDVGSGKTVVSAIAMYLAFLNGYQSVLMAPTEILAQQHFNTIKKLLLPLDVKVNLITGSNKSIKYKEVSIKNKNKEIPNTKYLIQNTDILIGTHAVLSEKINFDNLGLVVIDEQQRFGVEQRAVIRKKGKNPHLLTMTATPIPRTIALTMYGDLNLSFLDEMPMGRKKIKTWLVKTEKRNDAYEWVKKEIKENNSQVFIICPFIEESESMQTVKAAKTEFERLKKEVFQKEKLGLLHGKLKSKEKDQVLLDFKEKKLDILVATPVVEVGIDIPNAAIIIVEASERFGLSQLHQLRGRVGRGNAQSYCLLFTESKNPKTYERLKAMEKINNGAQLAELDLKLRGPGEIYGVKQHGLPMLKIASFSDFNLIEKTKEEAEKIFSDLEKYPLLKEKIKNVNIKEVSPD